MRNSDETEGLRRSSQLVLYVILQNWKRTGKGIKLVELIKLINELLEKKEVPPSLWPKKNPPGNSTVYSSITELSKKRLIKKSPNTHTKYLQPTEKAIEEYSNLLSPPKPSIPKNLRLMDMNSKISFLVGYHRWIKDQMEKEGIIGLAVSSCVELAASKEGWADIAAVKVDLPILDPRIEKIIENINVSYIGPAKYWLRKIEDGFTDNPALTLGLAPIEDLNKIAKTHVAFDEIKWVLGNELRLFDLEKSQIPNMLVIHLALITKDNYLLLCQRSTRPRYYKQAWSISVEEQVNHPQDNFNVWSAAMRGIKEELIGNAKSQVKKHDITFHSVFREFDKLYNEDLHRFIYVLNTGIAGIAKIPLSLEEVWINWRKKVESDPDKAESRNVVGVKISFDTLFRLLLDKEFVPSKYNDLLRAHPLIPLNYLDVDLAHRVWHPSNKIRLVCILRKYFQDEFEKEINRLFRRDIKS